MMEQAIENRSSQHLVAKYFAPVDEALVRGDDEASTLIPARYQSKEQVGFLPAHRQIAQFIDDEQLGSNPLLQLPLQPIFCLRPRRRVISVSRVRKSTRWPASMALMPRPTANMV